MFLALYPMVSISLNSFVLLEHLVLLLTSTLAINCSLRHFLNKAIGIINFTKPFLNFIDDTMIWYLNSKLDLNLSCAKGFLILISMVTWNKLKKIVSSNNFSAQFIKIISHDIKKLAITLMYCNRLHDWWSTQSRLATLLFSFIARRWVGLQNL